jgi:hypothetical protein
MEKTKRTMKTVGKVALVIVGCALAPIAIWVAFGVAMHQKAKAKAAGQPAPTFREILGAAGR